MWRFVTGILLLFNEMQMSIQQFSSILHFSETHALLPPLVPHKQCETATCLLKKKTKDYIGKPLLVEGRGGVSLVLFLWTYPTIYMQVS